MSIAGFLCMPRMSCGLQPDDQDPWSQSGQSDRRNPLEFAPVSWDDLLEHEWLALDRRLGDALPAIISPFDALKSVSACIYLAAMRFVSCDTKNGLRRGLLRMDRLDCPRTFLQGRPPDSTWGQAAEITVFA